MVGTSSDRPDYFPGHFYCSGRENKIDDCFKARMLTNQYTCQSLPKLSCKNQINCIDIYIIFLYQGLPQSPEIFIIWPLNSTTIMAKWQLSYPNQNIATHLNITCFNTNDKEDNIIFTMSDPILITQEISITGFTASTKYMCCITVSTNIGTSQNVCQNVTLFNNVEQGKINLSLYQPLSKYK